MHWKTRELWIIIFTILIILFIFGMLWWSATHKDHKDHGDHKEEEDDKKKKNKKPKKVLQEDDPLYPHPKKSHPDEYRKYSSELRRRSRSVDSVLDQNKKSDTKSSLNVLDVDKPKGSVSLALPNTGLVLDSVSINHDIISTEPNETIPTEDNMITPLEPEKSNISIDSNSSTETNDSKYERLSNHPKDPKDLKESKDHQDDNGPDLNKIEQLCVIKLCDSNDYDQVCQQCNLKGVTKIESCFNGFHGKFTPNQIQQLKKDKRIESVETNFEIKAIPIISQAITAQAQDIDWSISRIGANKSSTISGNGSGAIDNVDVYILDTGIQKNHPDLNVVGGVSFVPGETDYDDLHGHGTAIAGVIAAKDNGQFTVGIVPGARLFAVKVLDKNGSGNLITIINGIGYVILQKKLNPNRPMVINMSLGGYVGTTTYNLMDQAVSNAIKAGIVVCIAAGNDFKDCRLFTPAHVTDALTVGAYDKNNKFASFSNFGPSVDICGPGVNILSTFKNTSQTIMSGTSLSCPMVTGTVVLYLSKNPKANPDQVKTALIQAANKPRFASTNQDATNPKIVGVPVGTTNLSIFVGNF